MRASHAVRAFICLTIVALTMLPTSAQAQVTVFRLQALNESGVRDGTCFVIRQETRADGTFLMLVRSARLFGRESERRPRVFVDDKQFVEISGEAITTPDDNKRDIAVLKTVVEETPVSPLPVTFDRVSGGSPFVISAFRPDGGRGVVAQRARFLCHAHDPW